MEGVDVNTEWVRNESERVLLFSKPSLLRRLQATMLDTLVIVFLMFTVSEVLASLTVEASMVRAICFVLFVLYEPLLVSMGQTLGQKLMGLKVRSYDQEGNLSRINILYSIVRFLIKVTLGWLSLLTIHSDKYGRAIHDMAAHSIVRYTK